MKLVWDMTINLNEADHGVGFQWPKDLQGTPFSRTSTLTSLPRAPSHQNISHVNNLLS